MAYKVIILYRLYMPSYFLGTFTEYPFFRQKEGQFETKKVCITKVIQTFHFLCTPSGIRTLDPLIKSQLLYQLS